MLPLAKLLLYILMIIPTVARNMVFWVMLFIVFAQYARMGVLRERVLGTRTVTPIQETAKSLGYGAIGGFFGSLLLTGVGVSITETGLAYIWPVAILLMLLGPRFLCFSYAGGLVSLFSLIFGFPKVGIPELMSLVAILHGIESMLIFLNGSTDAVPVFTEDSRGRTVGGFVLQKFWPIPIAVMVILTPEFRDLLGSPENTIKMPEWWPLIKPHITAPPGEELLYGLLAIPAALGYGDVALARSPQDRSRITSLHLLMFSAVLLVLAVASGGSRPLQFAAALFSPIGHELVIWLGRKMEFDGTPAFAHPDKGVKILYVIPGKPAHRAGLRSGDILLALNGHELSSRSDIGPILDTRPSYLCFDVLRETSRGRVENLEFTLPGTIGAGGFGIMFTPEPQDVPAVRLGGGGILARLFRRKR